MRCEDDRGLGSGTGGGICYSVTLPDSTACSFGWGIVLFFSPAFVILEPADAGCFRGR